VSQINKIIFKKFKTGEGDKNEWDTSDSFCILTPQLTSPVTFHPLSQTPPSVQDYFKSFVGCGLS
jgi:hypothetical protein